MRAYVGCLRKAARANDALYSYHFGIRLDVIARPAKQMVVGLYPEEPYFSAT